MNSLILNTRQLNDLELLLNGSYYPLEGYMNKKDIIAKSSGKISAIDNKKIGLLARIAGCPMDKFSGLYIYHHLGGLIKKNEKLITIYSDSDAKLKEAIRFYNEQKPILIR